MAVPVDKKRGLEHLDEYEPKPAKHLRSLHDRMAERRLVVILEGASLETVKVGKTFELLNCDQHKNMIVKSGRNPGHIRPDITHQLLHKLSVRASDGPQKLLRMIKNPVSDHLPPGCPRMSTSFSATGEAVCPRSLVPEGPAAVVIGAFAHGAVNVDYTEKTVSISNYPLSAALTCAKMCSAFEEVWGVL
ncbi:Ribosomal RNA small subunit methyltransferase NEP1 [Liparis tanakae]|uniref:Ribosomal RNA small subunit methyltransferase NEP1 n=1 Tax=Liparis tanakae TaxID=230148 RepID=A0A4Z2GGX1_9TELE|nr:Ribosomal RNA small subunit methyltransferase NEP1 [Liparis tanakae]